jgi:hypothetical protein
MRECTHNGLLYGGPHYFAHGVPPCVHHTFTHAKALTAVLNEMKSFKKLESGAPLPREIATGVKAFPEIDTSLVAFGPWRATISGSDWLYHDCFHATGGALALLYHEKIGTILASSLAKYIMAEPNNMQPLPDGVDFPLTPRVEMRSGDAWFTNLYDLTASISNETRANGIEFQIQTRLLDEKQQDPATGAMKFKLAYRFTGEEVIIRVEPGAGVTGKWSLVLPLVSNQDEPVRKVTDKSHEIIKADGRVVLEAGSALNILEMARQRAFNLVPGFQAVPFVVEGNGTDIVMCSLRVQN